MDLPNSVDLPNLVTKNVFLPVYYRKGHLKHDVVALALQSDIFMSWFEGMKENWESLVMVGLDINDIVHKLENPDVIFISHPTRCYPVLSGNQVHQNRGLRRQRSLLRRFPCQ